MTSYLKHNLGLSSFEKSVLKVVFNDYISNSLHFARKYARIFVRGHHLFLDANILGDPGVVSGDGEMSKTGGKKFGRRKVKNEKKRLFFSFLTFLRPNFFSPVLDIFPSPLTAPGSPRMPRMRREQFSENVAREKL